MQEYQEKFRCLICNKAQRSNGNGRFYNIGDNCIYLCAKDASPFIVGHGMGKRELNNSIFDMIVNIEDHENGAEIRTRICSELVNTRKITVLSSESGATTPRSLYNALDEVVVGQAQAKQQVSLSVYQHLQAIKKPVPLVPDRFNILFLGPSGTGKTLISHTIAQSLDLPFISSDATSFSPTGWQGADSETMIHDLFKKANEEVEMAERGVVFVDELDKIATSGTSSHNEFLNKGTQGTLLRLMEGRDVKVPGDHFADTATVVNTSRVLFMCGGAFPGLVDIVSKLRGNKRTIGFGCGSSTPAAQEAVRHYEVLSDAPMDTLLDALIEYGMSAELMGRIPMVVALAPLTKEELHRCLYEVDHSPVQRQKKLFAESGFSLEFTDAVLQEIVDTAYNMATGTRALNTLVKKAVFRAAFDLLAGPSRAKKGQVIIGDQCLRDPGEYRFFPQGRSLRKSSL